MNEIDVIAYYECNGHINGDLFNDILNDIVKEMTSIERQIESLENHLSESK